MTSQIFANIYLDELDRYIKHTLGLRYYLRYADDFIMPHEDEKYLTEMIVKIDSFLLDTLKIRLHPDKIIIKKFRQGIDFLGYICLPRYRIIRTKTKKRMFKKLYEKIQECKNGKINHETLNQSLQSYFGMLRHAKSQKIATRIKNSLSMLLPTEKE